MQQIDDYYTAAQVAEKLNLSRRIVRQLFKPGAIWPIVRINARVIRVPASSLHRYLAVKTGRNQPGGGREDAS
jgi:hypothetical protein